MPERPLLRLPTPSPSTPPPGPRGGSNIRFPSGGRQRAAFAPVFNRLREALARGGTELRQDPNGLAPERVIVFEIAGTVQNFLNALAKVRGLEFMAEYATEFTADENFAVIDDRKASKGQDRTDQAVPGRLYLAMPDMRALAELLNLWERWGRGEALGIGYTPFAHLFEQLKALRPWGPQDRIPEETLAFWREERERNPQQPVRTEIELWYHEADNRRRQAAGSVEAILNDAGGRVLHQSVIPEIAYHGMLVEIPAGYVQDLLEARAVQLAIADDVMFLRPQSVLLSPLEIEADTDGPPEGRPDFPPAGQPIAALLDGVPLQAHTLLADRLLLDDPDNLQARALVSRRVHGTAMASLILHGDTTTEANRLRAPSMFVRS
jgi:hypothetical protein